MRKPRWWLVSLLGVAGWASWPAGVWAQPSPKPLVFVEDSPEAGDRFERGRSLREQGRLSEAASALQMIVDEFPYKLIETGTGTYVDAPVRVRQELLLDPALLESYRSSFEPAAQRDYQAALASDHQADALGAVYLRYTLTKSGFQAGMALASIRILRAEPLEAARILDHLASHPDIETFRTQWALHQAAAGLYGRQPDRLEKYRKVVEASADPDAIKQLKEWIEAANLPPVNSTPPVAKRAPSDGLPGALWDKNLAEPASGPTAANADDADDAEPQIQSTLGPGAHHRPVAPCSLIPVGLADSVIVNDGKMIQSIDRFSGRELWTYRGTEDETQQSPLRPQLVQPGFKSVATDGKRIIGLMGTPMIPLGIGMGMGIGTPATSLTAVAADDGHLLWRIEPKDVENSMSTASFIETPIIDTRRVYALLKRTQGAGGDQYLYLAAFDLVTGKPLWCRTVSTAPINPAFSAARSPRMTLDADRIYVTDSMSVIGCADTATGSFQWLNLLSDNAPPPLNPYQFRSMQPNGMNSTPSDTPPFRVEAGLLVPGLGPKGSPVLLDPVSGKRIEHDLNDGSWPDVVMLRKVGDDILVVGSSVKLLSGKTLEPRWSKSLADIGASRPMGQPSLDGDRIAIASQEKILALRVGDGTVLWSVAAPRHGFLSGNLLWMDGQLIVASPDETLSSYMSWDLAYQSLKGQIAALPYDPRPALAMSQLAITAGQRAAALEGADFALEALKHMPPPGAMPANADASAPDDAGATHPWQREVFWQLLEFAQGSTAGHPSDPILRKAMFDRMAGIASSSPALDVEYRLWYGAFLTETAKQSEAIDEYQFILNDKTLSAQLFESTAATRRAGTEAKIRLGLILQQTGPVAYAKYDAAADQALTEATSRNPVDADALVAIAEQYPYAKASERALVLAADAMATSNTRGAIAQLNRAYLLAHDPSQVQQVVARLVKLHSDANQPQRAAGWLERMRREHKGVQPLRDGKPADIDAWLDELRSQQKQATGLPILTLPLGKPLTLPGRLLTPQAQDDDSWPQDQILVAEPNRLRFLAGPNLEQQWEASYSTETVELLSISYGQVVLWFDDAKLLLVLDAATGKPMWQAIAAMPLMQKVGGDVDREKLRPSEQRSFLKEFAPGPRMMFNKRLRDTREVMEEGRTGFMARVNDTIIALGDRAGRVVGIDRTTGEVVWQFLCPMDQLSLMELGPDALVLGGITGKLTDAQSGTVLVLDPLTGEMRMPALEDKSVPRWVGLAGEGLLLHRTDTELVIRQVGGQTPTKRIALSSQAGEVYSHMGSNNILVTDAPGSLILYDADSAKVVSRIGTSSKDLSWMEVEGKGQKWHVLTDSQATLLSSDGKVVWRDGVLSDERSYRAQLIGEKYVALLSYLGDQRSAAFAQPQPNQPRIQQPGEVPAPQVQLRVAGNQGRVVLRSRFDRMGQGMVVPGRGNELPKNFQYKVFILDRNSGLLVSEFPIETATQEIDAVNCQFLNHKLIFTAGGSTIVVPEAK